MKDNRLAKLADTLVNYSLEVKRGDKVLVESRGTATTELVQEITTKIAQAGGMPFWYYNDEEVERRWMLGATEQQVIAWGKQHAKRMKEMDCYMSVRGADNAYTMADLPPAKRKWYQVHYAEPVHMKIRVPKLRWVVMRYPNFAMSQLAETSREAFEDFYFSVCNVDYRKMSKAMDPLVKMMKQTDQVRLVGPGDTDLTFSIKGIPPVKCDGQRNIPDGEVYTAPVKTSINGIMQYNTPTLHDSTLYDGVRLEFKDGKIVKATCKTGDNAKLNRIFDTDKGARYIGEFAIGVNPNINVPMKDTLFDEKIYGSIHLTPGNCYDEAPNGNKSAIHWDMVMIQTKKYGGGEMYFDGKLIRKDGEFVVPALKKLSRKNLR